MWSSFEGGEEEAKKSVMGKFKRVCVYCGSHSGNRKIFSDAALDLGTEMVLNTIFIIIIIILIIFHIYEIGKFAG